VKIKEDSFTEILALLLGSCHHGRGVLMLPTIQLLVFLLIVIAAVAFLAARLQ
jgi:hypothetical protein